MKARPITFSAEMVRAILDGSKTQTRRPIKPQPPSVEQILRMSGSNYHWMQIPHNEQWWQVAGPVWAVREAMSLSNPRLRCRYGATGDLLWVKETWRLWEPETSSIHGEPIDPAIFEGRLSDKGLGWLKSGSIEYKADIGDDGPWRSARYMPRWASRITLRITDIRIERVQDISYDDAIAEGIRIDDFNALWNSIYGERHPWSSNPWVWVLEFEIFEIED